jgi:nitrite reductase/ring-hydroxylating ferredoxin subunit
LWDTNDPYDYVRIDAGRNGTEIIYGGEDHKTGQVDDTEVCFEKLKSKLLALFPKAKFDHRWSGQVVETNDGLPYLGETAPHQFAATGYAGNGLTFGTLAGLMACDAALGRENPWQDLFSIERTKIRHSAWDYLQENFDFPLYFIKDRLRSAEGNSVQGLKPGEGKILKLDGQRVACSRSDDGTLQAVSPVCTHLGCLVHWNRAEGTWDCPCHGSRFKASGDVLAGPAETPLEAYPIDAQGHLHLEEASS